MPLVNECPTNLTEIAAASKRLECVNDKYGNNQYLCVPDKEKTSLVELCYDGIMGIQEKGICLEVDGKNLTTHSCLNFSSGCPKDPFWNFEFYKYPECQNISSQHRCYIMDPSCPVPVPSNANERTSHTVFIYTIIPSVILCLALIAFVSVVIFRKRMKSKQEKGAEAGYVKKARQDTFVRNSVESYIRYKIDRNVNGDEVEPYMLHGDANSLMDLEARPMILQSSV